MLKMINRVFLYPQFWICNRMENWFATTKSCSFSSGAAGVLGYTFNTEWLSMPVWEQREQVCPDTCKQASRTQREDFCAKTMTRDEIISRQLI